MLVDRLEAVAEAAHGLDHFLPAVFAENLSQPPDMDVHRPLFDKGAAAKDDFGAAVGRNGAIVSAPTALRLE